MHFRTSSLHSYTRKKIYARLFAGTKKIQFCENSFEYEHPFTSNFHVDSIVSLHLKFTTVSK